MTELTETDYGTLALALGKCRLMQDFTKDGAMTGPGAASRDGGDATKPEENGN